MVANGWGKIITDHTGWDFRMWPLVITMGWSHLHGCLIRKYMAVMLRQKKGGHNNKVPICGCETHKASGFQLT